MDKERRTWQHIFEDRSVSQLNDAIESIGWAIEVFKHDYGEDLYCRIFEGGRPTGHDFFIQIKGTDKPEQYLIKRGKSLSYSVDLSNLAQWHSFTIPVLFVVWNIKKKFGYWVHVQPVINKILEKNPKWLKNQTGAKNPKRALIVPADQIIKENNLRNLEQIINLEWKKLEQAKAHFELIYEGSSKSNSDIASGRSPIIKNHFRIAQLHAILKSQPKESSIWLDLASECYEIGNMSEALKAINRAWKLNSGNRNIMQARACILAEFAILNNSSSSMLREAIKLFNLSKSKSNNSSAYYNIGNCYSELKRYSKAVEYYDKALKAKPEKELAAQIWTNRGNSADKKGDTREALKSFRSAIKFNPALWNVHASWAALEVRHGNYINACKHFKDAFDCNPDLAISDNNVGYWFSYSLFQIKKLKESLDLINQVLDANPVHKDGLLLKFHLLYHLRRSDKSYTSQALTFFEDQLLDNPGDMKIRSELNLIYRDEGLLKKQRKLLIETMNFPNPPPMAYYDYAMILEEENKLDKAISYIEMAYELEQGHLIVHSLARLKRKVGDYLQAIEYYRLILKDVSDPLSILEKIADCYFLLGDYRKCIIVLSKVLILGGNQAKVAWWNNLYFALEKLKIDSEEYILFLRNFIFGKRNITEEEIEMKVNTMISVQIGPD